MPPPPIDSTKALASALRRDRASWIPLLVLLPLASWAWIIAMGRDMYGAMTGASRWMMTPAWDAPHLFLLWLMWAVMMTGMMLPSASPVVLLAAGVARARGRSGGRREMYALGAGYLAVWALFSAAITLLQWGLMTQTIVSPMMELTTPAAGALLLALAGVYQLTPLKQVCLTTCQSPMAFLMQRWRSGASGAFRMGVEHGAYCVGCCWALMLLLFVGGVMNLTVIAALTLFVAFEKLTPLGRRSGPVSGALLLSSAAWLALR